MVNTGMGGKERERALGGKRRTKMAFPTVVAIEVRNEDFSYQKVTLWL